MIGQCDELCAGIAISLTLLLVVLGFFFRKSIKDDPFD